MLLSLDQPCLPAVVAESGVQGASPPATPRRPGNHADSHIQFCNSVSTRSRVPSRARRWEFFEGTGELKGPPSRASSLNKDHGGRVSRYFLHHLPQRLLNGPAPTLVGEHETWNVIWGTRWPNAPLNTGSDVLPRSWSMPRTSTRLWTSIAGVCILPLGKCQG